MADFIGSLNKGEFLSLVCEEEKSRKICNSMAEDHNSSLSKLMSWAVEGR